MLLVVLSAGCATPIGVNRVTPQEANQALTASVLSTGEIGVDASQFLSRRKLSERFAKDPVGTIREIHSKVGLDDPAQSFVLSELSFAYAQKSGDRA
jgi:hypothetical protein